MFEHNYKDYPELRNDELQLMQFTSPHKQITEDFVAVVVKVHDGDTITLRTSFRDFDFPLRLAGINAPEMNEGGEVARDWLRGRILDKTVYIELDSKRVEKWGRLLGRIVCDGLDVGSEMLFMGLVKEYEARNEGLILNMIERYKWLPA